MILYIDTKIIQKLNKATPFRSVFKGKKPRRLNSYEYAVYHLQLIKSTNLTY